MPALGGVIWGVGGLGMVIWVILELLFQTEEMEKMARAGEAARGNAGGDHSELGR